MGPDGESIRVLHVDDEPDFSDVTRAFLERDDERFDIDTAATAREALERLDSDVDCVVSDYDMPATDGIEFLERLREGYPDLPFILFTGKGSEEVASDAFAAGATDYLQKAGGTDQYELLANRIRNAVEQYRSSQRADKLDRIRSLTSDVKQALIRAKSRTEAETRACEILSDSEPYLFAWIGGADPETGRVTPRISAGIEEGYFEDLTITADDSPTGQGPGGTAIRERRIAVSQDIATDPDFERWRDKALERGYQSVAAVPLEYEESLYGILVVYAARPDAFDGAEQDLLAEVGGDISHAIHSFDVQDRLREERDRREALFENAPGPVIASEVRGERIVMTDVNDAFEEVFGYDAEDVIGADPTEVIVPKDGMDRHEGFRERARAGATIVTEVDRVTADGIRTFLLHIIPYRGTDGEVTGMYAWYTDITSRRERERAIESLDTTAREIMRAETADAVGETVTEALRDILDMPINALWLHDEDAGVLRAVAFTDRTTSVVGDLEPIGPGDGLAWEVFETGEVRRYDDVSTEPGRLNPETPIRSEIILPLGDHGVITIGATDAGVFDEVDVSLAQTVADHTETVLDRLEYEQELHREAQRFDRLLETSPAGITILDSEGEIVRANRHAEDVLGLDKSEITERAYDDPAWDIIGEDGEPIPAEALPFSQVVETGEPVFGYEHGIEWPDGTRRWLSIDAAPLESETGEIEQVIAVVMDVTEQRARERRLKRQNERLEEFASFVSHDLRNPLNIADGRLELARETCDSEHLDEIAQAHDRIRDLIEDLLTLAREGKQTADIEAVDLAEIVDGCWGNVDTADATLTIDTARTIRADRSRLKQLLENLFLNSVEHSGGDVTVTVGALDEGFYIADDGPGIPTDERESVFEAGYSTSPEGTGFGLAIVREIADAHGWTVTLTDGDDGGTRFEVTGVEFV